MLELGVGYALLALRLPWAGGNLRSLKPQTTHSVTSFYPTLLIPVEKKR